MSSFEIPLADVKTTHILSNGKYRIREVDKKVLERRIASIKQFGQLQPIIIDRQNELIDGMYRYTACTVLGKQTIRAEYYDAVDELTRRTLELEANLQREDMDWQERAFGLAELDRIRKEANPEWSQGATAAEADTERSRVTEAVLITKMAELFPEIKEAKSMNQALSWAKDKASLVVRKAAVAATKDEQVIDIASRITLGDSVDVIKTMPDEFVDLVLTDPPFGIDYDNRKTGTAGTLSSYEDDEENYERLLTMAPDLYRIIKPNGWLVWFFGISWYERCKEVFRKAGFTVDEIPIIWDRSEGRAHTNRPDHYFGRAYDVALHCFKGDPQIVQRGKPNIIRVAPVATHDRELLVERPVELYQELIRRLTVEGELVVDFFTGSGSVLAAAASLRRKYLGVELSDERRAVAVNKIKGYTAQ